MKLICLLFGHKKMKLNTLHNFNKMMFTDQLSNTVLINLCMCERCNTAFFETFLKSE